LYSALTLLPCVTVPPPPEPYPLSLPDALPILGGAAAEGEVRVGEHGGDAHAEARAGGIGDLQLAERERLIDQLEAVVRVEREVEDRKSTRLNSSHVKISYAVFCLKKKKTHQQH